MSNVVINPHVFASSDYPSGIGSDGDMDVYTGSSSSSGQPSGLGSDALSLSGTSYSASLTGGQVIPVASDWTFHMFSLLDAFENSWMIGANTSASSNKLRIEFTTSGGGVTHRLSMIFADNSGYETELSVEVTDSYTTGVYHLIGVTYEKSSGTISLFIDGVLIEDNGGSSATGGFGTVTDYVFFNVSGEAYAGKATEMVTRNIALTLANFVTLWNSGDGLTADQVEKDSIMVYYDGQDTTAPITNVAI